MSHRGSILIRADGVHAWQVSDAESLTRADLTDVLDDAGPGAFVLLGTGKTLAWPPREVRDIAAESAIALECMDTGAAVRTYNILLNEGRAVVAALIAVPGA